MKSNSVDKDFDCVEFKRKAQSRIYAQIKGLSPREEIEYFRKAADEGPFAEWWKGVAPRASGAPRSLP